MENEMRTFLCVLSCTELTYLYTRPWFERIWDQQEIFAAGKLIFQCGNLPFEWSNLVSQPTLLSTLPHLQPYSKPLQDRKEYNKLITEIPDDISAQFDAISKLVQLHKYNLNCFEQFLKKSHQKPDFIEALLYTGVLNVTNLLDYIYGIVGMTEFPAKAMTVQEWTVARQHEVFIPIDYSANLTSILSAVTWAALMKGSLGVIAKFKVFTIHDDNNACEHPLPSWVIDWRLATRLFRRRAYEHNYFGLTLENAWAVLWALGPIPRPPPATQEQFCQDNRNGIVPYTKLIVRGMVEPKFRAEGKCIWGKRRWLTDKAVWQLECDVYPTELVVYALGFTRVGCQGLYLAGFSDDRAAAARTYSTGGLWLLRRLETLNSSSSHVYRLSRPVDTHSTTIGSGVQDISGKHLRKRSWPITAADLLRTQRRKTGTVGHSTGKKDQKRFVYSRSFRTTSGCRYSLRLGFLLGVFLA